MPGASSEVDMECPPKVHTSSRRSSVVKRSPGPVGDRAPAGAFERVGSSWAAIHSDCASRPLRSIVWLTLGPPNLQTRLK